MKKSTIIDSAQNLQMTLSVKHVVPSQNEYMLVDGVSDENSIVGIKFTIDERLNQGCVEILCQEVYHFTPDVTLTENDYAMATTILQQLLQYIPEDREVKEMLEQCTRESNPA